MGLQMLSILLFFILSNHVMANNAEKEVKSIPVIDASRFFNGTKDEKRSIAMSIGKACEEVGFFIIRRPDHIDKSVIDNAWAATSHFFDLDISEKLQYERAQEVYPFGYTRLGGEVLSSGKKAEKNQENLSDSLIQPPDLKEMFSLGPGDPAAGFPERIFPISPSTFADAWALYYDTLAGLAREILSAFAIALELPDERYFDVFVNHHASALRCASIYV